MKGQIILHAIGNEGKFNYYVLDKRQKVAKALSHIFVKSFDVYWDFHHETPKGKIVEINIEKYKDVHETHRSIKGNARVDIFYGDKRMFFAIHCTEKQRLKFNEALSKISKMPKPPKKHMFKSKK